MHMVAQIGDVSIDAVASRDYEGSITHQGSLPAGKAGTLSLRTDNDSGEATLGGGHGIETGDEIDIFWAGGSRYGVTVGTVDGNTVPFGAGGGEGAGDNLPAQATAIVVTKRKVITDGMTFAGNNLKMLVIHCPKRIRFTFESGAGAALLSLDLPANEPWSWLSDQGVTNPLAGVTPASLHLANGESDAAATVKVGGKIDSM
jgi:hypothetical protein